jgi:DNA-binding transcriptional MerR regulator
MKRASRKTSQRTNEESVSMPKYPIGVVSELLGLPPQVLRRYEEAGLLEPARQSGKNRLYSDQDIAMLEEIAELSDQGVNAVGIRHIIEMRRQVRVLELEVEEARTAQKRAEEEKQRTEQTLQQWLQGQKQHSTEK